LRGVIPANADRSNQWRGILAGLEGDWPKYIIELVREEADA
jgi:hypothetical protein